MRRREFIRLLGSVAVLSPLDGRAQQTIPVIGVLGSASAEAYKERLSLIRQGLTEAGFKEGHTVAMEYRWADGHLDRLPALAADLVGRGVDVIIATGGLQSPHAALSATSTTPIVFSTDGDPVNQGLVSSLNRPGGTATGITVFSAELTAKRLGIFRELVPKAKVIGVLVNPEAAQAQEQIQDAEQSGRALGLEMKILNARSDADFEPALTALGAADNPALLVSSDPLFVAQREKLVAVVNRLGIPAIYGRRDFVAVGGLASYGANLVEPYRSMGVYVGRILRGEKPGDLPVLQPTKFELVINLKTAKTLGLTIPTSIQFLANEVIE